MALRISRAITRAKITKVKNSNPAMIHPTETSVPMSKTTVAEMIPIHSEHAAPSRTSILNERNGIFTKY